MIQNLSKEISKNPLEWIGMKILFRCTITLHLAPKLKRHHTCVGEIKDIGLDEDLGHITLHLSVEKIWNTPIEGLFYFPDRCMWEILHNSKDLVELDLIEVYNIIWKKSN